MRPTGIDRTKLTASLKKRYEAGESIRSLAASTGRSYNYVHRILTEAGVILRGRGGSGRTWWPSSRHDAPDADQTQIPVQIFLADSAPGPAVEKAVRELLRTAGVEDVLEEQFVIRPCGTPAGESEWTVARILR